MEGVCGCGKGGDEGEGGGGGLLPLTSHPEPPFHNLSPYPQPLPSAPNLSPSPQPLPSTPPLSPSQVTRLKYMGSDERRSRSKFCLSIDSRMSTAFLAAF